MIVMPVALPPGRERLAAKPSRTGSPPITNTMGIVELALLAANAELDPPTATSAEMGRFASSAAISGNRSNAPSAKR